MLAFTVCFMLTVCRSPIAPLSCAALVVPIMLTQLAAVLSRHVHGQQLKCNIPTVYDLTPQH